MPTKKRHEDKVTTWLDSCSDVDFATELNKHPKLWLNKSQNGINALVVCTYVVFFSFFKMYIFAFFCFLLRSIAGLGKGYEPPLKLKPVAQSARALYVNVLAT